MERQSSMRDMLTMSLETFKLPEDFAMRLQELEIALHEGTLTHDSLKELFELYSTASSHYEAQGLMDEFNFYIRKMQDLLKNQNIQPLLQRRKSKEMIINYSLSIEEKKEKVEKIKNLIKENKKNNTSLTFTNDLIKNVNENKLVQIISQDLNTQEESFKKRLEEKRLLRGNSQPQFKLKVLFYFIIF